MQVGRDTSNEEGTFVVWRKADEADVDGRPYLAPTPRIAAERRAREDWIAGHEDWPTTYCVRDGEAGTTWAVDVTTVMRPTFVARAERSLEMPAATHVLWGARVLCEDLRLRGVPRDWPPDQCWISLKDAADGVDVPSDRCEACWRRMPGLVTGLRQIGAWR